MNLVFFSLFFPKWFCSSDIGYRFFSEMRSLAEEILPTVFGTVEPLNRNVSATEITGISQAWPEDVFWKNPSTELYGRVLHAKGNRHSSCKIRFELGTVNQDALAEFFSSAAGLLEADYGAIHLTGTRADESDRRFQGITSRSLSMSLPGVPWLACYGRPYIEMFGVDRLVTCPAFRIDRISESSVIVQSSETLVNAQSSNAEFQRIQSDIIDHLGRDAFFDPSNPNQTQRTPVFCFSQ